jgi:hypothetical protein
LDDQIKKNEMGRACGIYEGEKRCIQVTVGNLNERDHLEDVGINGRIILQWMLNSMGGRGLD